MKYYNILYLICTFSDKSSFYIPYRKGIAKKKFLAFTQFFPNNKYLIRPIEYGINIKSEPSYTSL